MFEESNSIHLDGEDHELFDESESISVGTEKAHVLGIPLHGNGTMVDGTVRLGLRGLYLTAGTRVFHLDVERANKLCTIFTEIVKACALHYLSDINSPGTDEEAPDEQDDVPDLAIMTNMGTSIPLDEVQVEADCHDLATGEKYHARGYACPVGLVLYSSDADGLLILPGSMCDIVRAISNILLSTFANIAIDIDTEEEITALVLAMTNVVERGTELQCYMNMLGSPEHYMSAYKMIRKDIPSLTSNDSDDDDKNMEGTWL